MADAGTELLGGGGQQDSGSGGKTGIGFPPGFQYVGIEKWLGVNTQPQRASIEDDQVYWLENIQPIGEGNARFMYGRGATLYTVPAGRSIIYYESFSIGFSTYFAVFLDNGTAYQVAVPGGAVTTISGSGGAFYGSGSGNLPHITQWGSNGILIVSESGSQFPNGYWAWDGTTIYQAGDTPPSWLSGLAAPIVTAASATSSSGTLTGVAPSAFAQIQTGMSVSGPGIPANTFTTGGSGTSSGGSIFISNPATATTSGNYTFLWPMPSGISGTSIDTFQQRVWIAFGAFRITSAAGNGAYFAAANGGVIVQSGDSNLRSGYTHVIAANGYVYYFGDSSIYVISSVNGTLNSTTNTTTTTYQYSNVDPQTGVAWLNTVQVFGRSIMFANTNGIYALTGNSAQKVSSPLDGIWSTINASTVTPTSAVATINGIRCYICCFEATDVFNVTRPMMALWDSKRWWIASQETVPVDIDTVEINSNLTAYGTDKNIIFPMFQTASTSLTKTVQSKLYGGQYKHLSIKQILRYYLQMDTLSTVTSTITLNVDTDEDSLTYQVTPVGQAPITGFIVFTVSGGALQFYNNTGTAGQLFWTVSQSINTTLNLIATNVEGAGNLIGFTMTSTLADAVYERIGLGYQDQTAFY